MQEISLESFNRILIDFKNLYSIVYWKNSFTTEYDVKEHALLIMANNENEQRIVKGVLQVIESKGHLKLILFNKDDKQEYIIPFYNIELAHNEFLKITC